MDVWGPIITSYRRWMMRPGLSYTHYKPDDKNSLFRAIADQCEGPTIDAHRYYRTELARFCRENADVLARGEDGDEDDVAVAIRMTGERTDGDAMAAGPTILKALSLMNRCRVYVWSLQTGHRISLWTKSSVIRGEDIHLLYDSRHQMYGSVRVMGCEAGPAHVIVKETINGVDMLGSSVPNGMVQARDGPAPQSPPASSLLAGSTPAEHVYPVSHDAPPSMDMEVETHSADQWHADGNALLMSYPEPVSHDALSAVHAGNEPTSTEAFVNQASQPVFQALMGPDGPNLPDPEGVLSTAQSSQPLTRLYMPPPEAKDFASNVRLKVQPTLVEFIRRGHAAAQPSASSMVLVPGPSTGPAVISLLSSEEDEEPAAATQRPTANDFAYMEHYPTIVTLFESDRYCINCHNQMDPRLPPGDRRYQSIMLQDIFPREFEADTGRFSGKICCGRYNTATAHRDCAGDHSVHCPPDKNCQRCRRAWYNATDEYMANEKAWLRDELHGTPAQLQGFFSAFVGRKLRPANWSQLSQDEQSAWSIQTAQDLRYSIRAGMYQYGRPVRKMNKEMDDPKVEQFITEFKETLRRHRLSDQQVFVVNTGAKTADMKYTLALGAGRLAVVDLGILHKRPLGEFTAPSWLHIHQPLNQTVSNYSAKEYHEQVLRPIIAELRRIVGGKPVLILHDMATFVNVAGYIEETTRLAGLGILQLPTLNASRRSACLNALYRERLAENFYTQLDFALSQVAKTAGEQSLGEQLVRATTLIRQHAITGTVVTTAWKATTLMGPNGTFTR